MYSSHLVSLASSLTNVTNTFSQAHSNTNTFYLEQNTGSSITMPSIFIESNTEQVEVSTNDNHYYDFENNGHGLVSTKKGKICDHLIY